MVINVIFVVIGWGVFLMLMNLRRNCLIVIYCSFIIYVNRILGFIVFMKVYDYSEFIMINFLFLDFDVIN